MAPQAPADRRVFLLGTFGLGGAAPHTPHRSPHFLPRVPVSSPLSYTPHGRLGRFDALALNRAPQSVPAVNVASFPTVRGASLQTAGPRRRSPGTSVACPASMGEGSTPVALS